MTRIVELRDTRPLKIDPKEHDEPVWICRCGLSAKWPFCDSSHAKTRGEEPGMMYAYQRVAAGAPLERRRVPDPHADPRPAQAPATPDGNAAVAPKRAAGNEADL